jgi:Pirin
MLSTFIVRAIVGKPCWIAFLTSQDTQRWRQATDRSWRMGSGAWQGRYRTAFQAAAFGPEPPGLSQFVRADHTGLSTVTCLFEGAIMHRDSLGSPCGIEPGVINWMTAGRGIVHSELAPEEMKAAAYVHHGTQLWAGYEKVKPAFEHTPLKAIPALAIGDAGGTCAERAGLWKNVTRQKNFPDDLP